VLMQTAHVHLVLSQRRAVAQRFIPEARSGLSQ
jgi:hypothetical protein